MSNEIAFIESSEYNNIQFMWSHVMLDSIVFESEWRYIEIIACHAIAITRINFIIEKKILIVLMNIQINLKAILV